MTRKCVEALVQLHAIGANSGIVALSIEEIMKNWDVDISQVPVYSTLYHSLMYLVELDLVRLGPKKGKSSTYFISKEGAQYLSEIS